MNSNGLSLVDIQKALISGKVGVSKHAEQAAIDRGINIKEGFFNILKDTNAIVYLKSYIDFNSLTNGVRITYLDGKDNKVLLVFVENSMKNPNFTAPIVLKSAQYFIPEYASERKNQRAAFTYEYTSK